MQTACRAIIENVSEPTPAEALRVSDTERSQVQDRLRRAHGAGQLDLYEFDERVKAVWAARTRGELSRVTADLPEPASPARPGIFTASPGGVTMRVLTIVWLGVVTVNLVVWSILALTLDEPVYPWWLLVAGPSGAVLGVLYAAGIGRPKR